MAETQGPRNERLRYVAYHEAGHVLLNYLSGFRFVRGCTIDSATVLAWKRDARGLSDEDMHDLYTSRGIIFGGLTDSNDTNVSPSDDPDVVNHAYLTRAKSMVAGICATELLPRFDGTRDLAIDDLRTLETYLESRTQYCQNKGLADLLRQEPREAFEERVWREARADIAANSDTVHLIAHALLTAPSHTLTPDDLYHLLGRTPDSANPS